MPFERPTLKQIEDRIRNDIAGAVRMTQNAARTTATTTARAAALLRRSVVAVKARAYAGACHLLYGFLHWLADQRFVHKMEAEFLDAEGMTYDTPRKSADTAKGPVAVTGTDGASILIDRIYRHDDGGEYRVTAAAAISNGTTTVKLEATTPGVAGNLRPGEKLRPLQPIPGVHDTATVIDPGIEGGVDIEADEAYRERILTRKRQPPHGGAAHDYVAWALEVPGVTRAWPLPLWMGLGTVGVMFMRDNDLDPFPSDEQCAIVKAHIEKKRPVTAEVFVFAPVPLGIDIAAKLSPDTDEIRAAVEDELDDLLFREGKPDSWSGKLDTWLRVSRISEAISTAVGEHHHYLTAPVNDIHVPANAIPYLHRVVFIDNPEG